MLDTIDKQLITVIQDGLPLTARPYATIAEQIHQSETEVIRRIEKLQNNGTIKRLGVVVKHRALGFKANAMVVWNISDDRVKNLAQKLAAFECITLCYQRPRRLPDWPYNLFTMIHGKDRDSVLKRLNDIVSILELQDIPHQPLFSTKQFKQRGGRYLNSQVPEHKANAISPSKVLDFTSKQQQKATKSHSQPSAERDFTDLLKPLYG